MKSACSLSGGDSPRERFLAMLPRIREKLVFEFREMKAEELEEALAECYANAWFAYRRLVELGKELLAYAYPLATYAAKHYRTGRRVTGDLAREVMSPLCERRHGVTCARFHVGQWDDFSAEHSHATPADLAAFRVDFAAWLETLSPFKRTVLEMLRDGERVTDIASKLGCSQPRISHIRRELDNSWKAFHGEPA